MSDHWAKIETDFFFCKHIHTERKKETFIISISWESDLWSLKIINLLVTDQLLWRDTITRATHKIKHLIGDVFTVSNG